MTGPEHYREAERLLTEAAAYDAEANQTTIDVLKLTAAQVHATLALTAATAEPIAVSYDGTYDTSIPKAWSGAIS